MPTFGLEYRVGVHLTRLHGSVSRYVHGLIDLLSLEYLLRVQLSEPQVVFH